MKDREAWRVAVHGTAESDTTYRLNNNFNMGFPGGSVVKNLPECRRHRFDPWVGKIPWRRKWQLTPVVLPEEFHRQKSLVGYSPWG